MAQLSVASACGPVSQTAVPCMASQTNRVDQGNPTRDAAAAARSAWFLKPMPDPGGDLFRQSVPVLDGNSNYGYIGAFADSSGEPPGAQRHRPENRRVALQDSLNKLAEQGGKALHLPDLIDYKEDWPVLGFPELDLSKPFKVVQHDAVPAYPQLTFYTFSCKDRSASTTQPEGIETDTFPGDTHLFGVKPSNRQITQQLYRAKHGGGFPDTGATGQENPGGLVHKAVTPPLPPETAV